MQRVGGMCTADKNGRMEESGNKTTTPAMPADHELDAVAQWMREAERITVFTGAGISTDSGIPDFRGPNGLWTTNPLAELTSRLSYYMGDPEVRKVAWQGRLRNFNDDRLPNDGHRAVARIEKAGRLHALVTQNVDGLHQLGGVSDHLVYEVHGTIRYARCVLCGDRRPLGVFLDRVRAGEEDPDCETCGGIVKTDVILFEEPLVPEVIEGALAAGEDCDLLLAIGSTLSVTPAAYVVDRARAAGRRVVIVNGGPTERDRYADLILTGSITPILTALADRAEFPT